jgi:hexokinase
VHQNELVIRIQPDEAVYMKLMSRLPGLAFAPTETELALSYSARFAERASPEAYSRLLYDVIRGEQAQFVRDDELVAAWAIFTPLLARIEAERVAPVVYPYGSRGPPQADDLIRAAGYVFEGRYAGEWRKGNDPAAALAALAAVRAEFTLSTARLRAIAAAFLADMRRGLAGEPSQIKMIPSFVTAVPTGRETGASWAIDLGGSNLRVLEVALGAHGATIAREHKVTIPAAVLAGAGAALFDFIAAACATAGMGAGAKLGFTFSFPYEQTAINAGVLLEWTKGFSAPGVVGTDVAAQLEAALARAGVPTRVAALANDTVGTLVSAAFTHPAARVGLILGTGTNCAYVERAAAIPKWRGRKDGDMLINMEWGAFGSDAPSALPLHAADHALDLLTPNVGRQRFEKMISGFYLGEIARDLLTGLVAAGALFSSDAAAGRGAKRLNTQWAFTTAMMSTVAEDASAARDATNAVLQDGLDVAASTLADRELVAEVCALVARRAARLTAAGLAAIVEQMGAAGAGAVIGVDGSVYKKYPRFAEWMDEALAELGAARRVVHSDDGSGIGAALIAVVA